LDDSNGDVAIIKTDLVRDAQNKDIFGIFF
jgi:hypothetical protein